MAGRLYKRGKTWWGWVIDADGKRSYRSTGQQDRQAAEAVLRELERRAANPAYAAAHTTTLGAALERLIRDRKFKARADATLTFYRAKAGHLVRLLGAGTPLAKVDACAVDDYVEKRLDEGAARNTISKELTTLRATLKVAKRRGEFSGDIDQVMPEGFSAGYKPRERFLSPAEATALLAELIPDRAARVAFIIGTGARLGESDRAMRVDVDLARGVVRLRGTKTESSRRTVPLAKVNHELVAHAVKYGEGEDGLLFTPWGNVRRDLEAACERAGIPKVSPNDLRRTCATWMRNEGVPTDAIGAFLGHRDSRMVERVYGRLSPDALGSILRRQMGTPEACSTFVVNEGEAEASEGPQGSLAATKTPRIVVSGTGIEPATRGFSIPQSRG
jgi:integrase